MRFFELHTFQVCALKRTLVLLAFCSLNHKVNQSIFAVATKEQKTRVKMLELEDLNLEGLQIYQDDTLYRFTSDSVLLSRFAGLRSDSLPRFECFEQNWKDESGFQRTFGTTRAYRSS